MKLRIFLLLSLNFGFTTSCSSYSAFYDSSKGLLNVSSAPRQPSSLEFWPGRCEFTFSQGPQDQSKDFDLKLFERLLGELKNSLTMTESEIAASTRNPEAFLALLEHSTQLRDQQGFHFRDALAELSLKERRNLAREINQVLKPGQNSFIKRNFQSFMGLDPLTTDRFHKLVATIYRQIHKPRGFFKTLMQTKSLNQAFEAIDDQTIFSRLERSFYLQGLNKTFASVIVDPSWSQRSQIFYRQHQGKIKLALAAAAWGLFYFNRTESFPDPSYAGQVLDNLFLAPPFLPTLKYYFDRMPTESELLQMQIHEKAKALNLMSPGWKIDLHKDRRIKYLKYTYFAIFGIALLSATHFELEHQKVLEYERQLQSEANSRSRILNMDPRERATQQTEADMALLLKINPNLKDDAKEYQRVYRETFESYLSAIEKK